jgi:hypothetical protein
MTRTKAELLQDARTVKRQLCVYICPTCKRRTRAVKKPRRCCGVPLVFVGSVTEVVNEQEKRIA